MWSDETKPDNQGIRNCLRQIPKAMQKFWDVMWQDVKAHAGGFIWRNCLQQEDLRVFWSAILLEVTTDGSDLSP